eukprot:Em0002g1799a
MNRISKRRTEAPVCYSYRADPEKNMTSVCDWYNVDIESKRSAKTQALPHPMLGLYENPESMSEESEQVAEMDTSEISAFDTDVIDAQAVTITNCGIAGNIVQAALQFGLAFVPNSGIVGVSVNCALRVGSYVCTNVAVSVRGVQYTSVRACVAPNGNVCVKVNAAPRCQPRGLAAAIPLSIPVQTKNVPATLRALQLHDRYSDSQCWHEQLLLELLHKLSELSASAAFPTLWLVSARITEERGDVTLMSNAADLPYAQSFTSTSAGRECDISSRCLGRANSSILATGTVGSIFPPDTGANFITGKRDEAKKLLSQLKEVAVPDPQVAITLLRICGSYCRLIHLAQTTPPNLVSDALSLFDDDLASLLSLLPMLLPGYLWYPLLAWAYTWIQVNSRLPLSAWWLGMDSSGGSLCSLCPEVALDPLGHHAVSLRIEMGSGLTPDHNHSHPADVLVEGWERGKPEAFGITVTSPLCPAFLGEASQVAGAAALAAETRKHIANDKRCQELGRTCVPIAMETYGNWGQEAKQSFSRLASRLATDSSQPKSKVIWHDKRNTRPADVLVPNWSLGKPAALSPNDLLKRHNTLRNAVHSTFQQAGLSAHLEVGCGWGKDNARTRPADILVTNWDCGPLLPLILLLQSPLNSPNMLEAGMYQGVSAKSAEHRKHTENDPKCAELGWRCIPLAVESYGAWGPEASKAFSQVATRLAIRGNIPKA